MQKTINYLDQRGDSFARIIGRGNGKEADHSGGSLVTLPFGSKRRVGGSFYPYSQPQTSKPELGRTPPPPRGPVSPRPKLCRALDARGQGGPPEAPRVDARELAVDPLAPVPVAEVAHQLLQAKPRIAFFGTQAMRKKPGNRFSLKFRNEEKTRDLICLTNRQTQRASKRLTNILLLINKNTCELHTVLTQCCEAYHQSIFLTLDVVATAGKQFRVCIVAVPNCPFPLNPRHSFSILGSAVKPRTCKALDPSGITLGSDL